MAGPSSSKRRIVDGEYFQNYGGMEQCINLWCEFFIFNVEGYRLSCLLASTFSFIEFLPNSTTVFLTLCEPTGILIKIPDAGPPINRQNVGTIEGTKGVQSLKKYLGKIWYI